MGDWPVGGSMAWVANAQAAGTNYSVQVGHTVADTKGSWVELVASTPHAVGMIELNVNATNFYGEFLIDVAIGASGSEVILVADLLFCLNFQHYWASHGPFPIPIAVPAGTRIAARLQCNRLYLGSNWLRMSTNLYPLNSMSTTSLQLCKTYGAVSSGATRGTAIDPGATVNTKGAWVELSSAVPYTIGMLFFSVGGAFDNAKTNAYWAVDIGIGAAGSEVAVVQDFNISLWTTTSQYQPIVSPLFKVAIPAGVRLAARCKCTANIAIDRLLDIVVNGFSG